MEFSYHLIQRTNFIRFYYDEAVKPFQLIKEQITNELPPFDCPPYSEDPEPPFLDQWLDADAAENVVGQSCIGLLADSLKLYLNAFKSRVLTIEWTNEGQKRVKTLGFAIAMIELLKEIIGPDVQIIQTDIIEQVVLARNRSQHGTELNTFNLSHDHQTLRKYPRPFFINDEDYRSCISMGGSADFVWFTPDLEMSRDKLFSAIEEIESLAA